MGRVNAYVFLRLPLLSPLNEGLLEFLTNEWWSDLWDPKNHKQEDKILIS